MYKHEFHSLYLHDNTELAEILGEEIVSRDTIHEWPVSSVQKVVTADGRKVIYKSQWGPTVEPEFYGAARSDLLPSARTILKADSHSCMLIEYIEAPLIQEMKLGESDIPVMRRPWVLRQQWHLLQTSGPRLALTVLEASNYVAATRRWSACVLEPSPLSPSEG